jgi:hypothetical protein
VIGQALFSIAAAGGWWLYYLEIRWRVYPAWPPLLAAWAMTIAALLRIAAAIVGTP